MESLGFCGLCQEQWVVGGAFNVVRFMSEKWTAVRVPNSTRLFDKFIIEVVLGDLPLLNVSYTWSNLRDDVACSI